MRSNEDGLAPNRREFCAGLWRTVSIVAAGSLVPACSGSSTSPSSAPSLPAIGAAVVSGTITLTVDAASPLASVGGAALVQTSAANVLVSRTAQDAFVALTAVCTHEQCIVSGFENSQNVCPCHGSRFTTSGAVANGPAPSPLHQFTTRFTANTLTITLA